MASFTEAFGMCTAWHSDGNQTRVKVRTGSNLQHLKMICGSTVVDESCAHYCVLVCDDWEAPSCVFRWRALGEREVPCQDANRYGDTPAASQGGPLSEVGAWGKDQVGSKQAVRPLGGAHHDEGEAVARKERNRPLAHAVEQTSPKLKQLQVVRQEGGYGLIARQQGCQNNKKMRNNETIIMW